MRKRPTADESKAFHKQVAEKFVTSGKIVESYIAAGGAPRQARKGSRALLKKSPGLRTAIATALADQALLLAHDVDRISPEQMKQVIRARLLTSIVTGDEKATNACKQLGSDKVLSMWQADSQVGMTVIQVPEGFGSRYSTAVKQTPALDGSQLADSMQLPE